MGLIDMFRDMRQDSQIRRLSTELENSTGQDVRASVKAQRVAENVGELNLLMLVTLRALLDKGILTYDDLGKYFAQIDAIDGKADGKITLEDVRNALGLRPPK
ncbi:MAG: hypothetical protein K8T20_13290 [Planctomycetes bacterium]|nr:hypothetical protein [Planctomycetota bacterium]